MATTSSFILRIGNGNDGEYPYAVIEMGEKDCPYAFMECVIPNLFLANHPARRHAYKETMVDGEAEYTIYATLMESHNGATEFGAAYKTASLNPDPNQEYSDKGIYKIEEFLDRGTLIKYRQKIKK